QALLAHADDVLDYAPDTAAGRETVCLHCQGQSGAPLQDVDFGEPDPRIPESSASSTPAEFEAWSRSLTFPESFPLLVGPRRFSIPRIPLFLPHGDLVAFPARARGYLPVPRAPVPPRPSPGRVGPAPPPPAMAMEYAMMKY